MIKAKGITVADVEKLMDSEYIITDYNDKEINLSDYHEDVLDMLYKSEVYMIYADDAGYIHIQSMFDEWDLKHEQKWYDMSDSDREYEQYLIAKDI